MSAQGLAGYRHETGPDFVGAGHHLPERFVPLLEKFSHPANAAQRAQLFSQLQLHYGNRYVQRVVSSYRLQNAEINERKNASEIVSKMGSGNALVHGNPKVTKLFTSDAHQPNDVVVQQQSRDGFVRRVPSDGDECPGYQPDEISTSRTPSGHLDPDVTVHAPGKLLIADFGVGWQSVKPATQAEPLLRSWLSTFESDSSYRLTIIGYSDCVGSDSVNTGLRQGRAEQVDRLLGHGARSRVTFRGMASLGDYVTSNTTIENRAKNRGVIIEYRQEITMPPITIPGTPGCVAAFPGSSTPTSIGSRGACGTGADFRYFDFPALSTSDQIKVYAFQRLSNASLEGIFRTELGALAGAVGNRMITRFMSGAGGALRHGPGSTISTLATASGTIANAARSVQRDINSQLTGQAASGTVDYRLLHPRLPAISFGFRDGTTLKGAIGGTQGLDLFIKDFNVPYCTRNYTATLRFEICDDFGVDTSDLYSPGLISFWVLQHERGGHQPFINEIILEKDISGSF
jgi:outer membrane protein OmpA-like peptidoglycan-associated protein